jgi:osmotically-inducible protein OsmY
MKTIKTDSQLQSDVTQELKWDPRVTHEHIGVSVSDGIVTLSGTVPSFFEKSQAESAAQRVEGVKAVVEKIEVKLPGSSLRDDQDIAKALLEEFKWNVQIPDKLIKINVENAWVELSGEVEWDYQRLAAAKAARNLTGVKGVVNNIALKSKKVQPEAIKQKIEEALKRRAEREAHRIAIEVEGNKVILSGKVDNLAEMQDVKWAAWSAPGVINVESNLRIG